MISTFSHYPCLTTSLISEIHVMRLFTASKSKQHKHTTGKSDGRRSALRSGDSSFSVSIPADSSSLVWQLVTCGGRCLAAGQACAPCCSYAGWLEGSRLLPADPRSWILRCRSCRRMAPSELPRSGLGFHWEAAVECGWRRGWWRSHWGSAPSPMTGTRVRAWGKRTTCDIYVPARSL